MCTYNGEKFLMEQLESIANQSQLPDELIICDDKSTDNTINIIKKFQEKAPFKVKFVINSKQLGSTKNFEKAIGLCSGDIIFLADQDDFWMIDKVEQIINYFDTHPEVALVFTNADITDGLLGDLGYSLWEAINFSLNEQAKLENSNQLEVLLKKNVVTGATAAFRTKYNETILPISQNWIHDGWIAIILAMEERIGFIDQSLIKYRQHSNNQIGALKQKVALKKLLVNRQVRVQNIIREETTIKDLIRHVDWEKMPVNKNNRDLMDDKLMHLELRRNLPTRFLPRSRIIWSNLQGYKKYSNGFSSILIDLLRF